MKAIITTDSFENSADVILTENGETVMEFYTDADIKVEPNNDFDYEYKYKIKVDLYVDEIEFR